MSIISKLISYLSYWFRRLRDWLAVKSRAMARFPELSERYIDQAVNQVRTYHRWGQIANEMPGTPVSTITGIPDGDEQVEIGYDIIYKIGDEEKWLKIKVPTRTGVTNNELRDTIREEARKKVSPPTDEFTIIYIEITSIIPINIPEPA